MSYHQLTAEERYQIYSYKKLGVSSAEIARLLNRHPSTISRELRRNTGRRGYRAKQAIERAQTRKRTAVKFKKLTAEVVADVELLLRQELSPEQVVAYLKRHKNIQLHHETLYRLRG